MSLPVCAGCRRPIVGARVEALGKAWHPDCLRCVVCGKPFADRAFYLHDGQPYHAACYDARFGIKCAVCGEFMVGQYIQNFWGDKYCLRHQSEYQPCYVCGRLVCAAMTGGGRPYHDGRMMCALCRAQAVDDQAQARGIMEQVQARLAAHGVETRGFTIPLEMVTLTRLTGESPPEEAHHLAHVRGRTYTNVRRVNGQEVARTITALHALGGLPPEYLEGILAHELGHVWFFMQQVDNLPQDLEEGLCNLFAYLLHQEKGSPEARHCIHALEGSTDPIYGEGFRRALAIYQKRGLPATLRGVTQHRRWPRE